MDTRCFVMCAAWRHAEWLRAAAHAPFYPSNTKSHFIAQNTSDRVVGFRFPS
jgi:hypothetical protein